MASTLLDEQGVHPDLIELQLGHAERNTVRAAYNRAQRLAERRAMMQAWADYLDQLKTGAKAVSAVDVGSSSPDRSMGFFLPARCTDAHSSGVPMAPGLALPGSRMSALKGRRSITFARRLAA